MLLQEFFKWCNFLRFEDCLQPLSSVAYLGIHFGGGGFKIFLEKLGYLHGAKRHVARGRATRLLGGFGGMPHRENVLKWCNLLRFGEYFAKNFPKKLQKYSFFI